LVEIKRFGCAVGKKTKKKKKRETLPEGDRALEVQVPPLETTERENSKRVIGRRNRGFTKEGRGRKGKPERKNRKCLSRRGGVMKRKALVRGALLRRGVEEWFREKKWLVF